MLALVSCCLFLLKPGNLTALLEWRISTLQKQGRDLPGLYNTTEKMAYAQKQASLLYSQHEAELPAILARLFETVPSGHSLLRVELKGGVLKISGTGVEVKEWLISQGFPANRITIEKMGAYQRFRAERPL